MNINELNSSNFLLFAIKYYKNSGYITREEFETDVKRIKYINRLMKKHHVSGELNRHLLMNHLIIIFNCWDDAAIPLLFHKVDQKYWDTLIFILGQSEFINAISVDLKTQLDSLKDFLSTDKPITT